MKRILNKLALLAVCAMTAALGRADETIVPTEGQTEYAEKITVADGTVTTLDLTSYVGETPFRLTGGLYTQETGKFVVKGADTLAFGATSQPGNDVHYPLLSADVAFADAQGETQDGKVILSGWVTLERATCPFEVADGTWLALWGDDPLGNGKKPFRVEKYNVYILSGTAFDSDVALTVAAGRTLRIKPCAHADGYFNWNGDKNDTIANDITLEEGATLDLRCYAQLTLTGDIAGTGTLKSSEGRGDANWAKLTGDVTLVGDLEVGSNLIINQATPGAAKNHVTVKGANNATAHTSLSLVPNGDTTVETTVSVDSFTGNHENSLLYAQPNQLMKVSVFNGTGELRGRDLTGSFEVDTLASGAKLYVRNCSERVTVRDVEPGVAVVARLKSGFSGPQTLAFPADKQVDSLTLESGVSVILESGSFGTITGTGTVIVRGDVKYVSIGSDIDLVVDSESSLVSSVDEEALESALGDLPALWLDASKADSLQEYTYNGHTVPEGTFPGIVVRRWNDCRETQGFTDPNTHYYALNARSSTGNTDGGYIRTMPYTMTNELNGLSVVSFGTYQGAISGATNEINVAGVGQGANSDTRRLLFNKPIAAKMVIMVHGHKDGGGSALIGAGGDTAGNSEFKNLIGSEKTEVEKSVQNDVYYIRPGATLDHRVLRNNKGVPFWMDGKKVDPYNTWFSTEPEYQILSMGVVPGDADPVLRSLGMSNTYKEAGGQRYAEILIYTNELTTVQRSAVERYLAKKWGLSGNYQGIPCPKSLNVAEGATFAGEIGGTMPISGTGSMTLAGTVAAEGVFAGSVTLAEDAVLTIPSRKQLWTEAQVADVSDRVGWFDPDCADDLTLDAAGANRIYAIFDHGNKDVADTPYLHGVYGNAVNNDRRPLLTVGARGNGPERGWVDFGVKGEGDVKGDNFRVKTDHSKVSQVDWNNVWLSVKTAFIVMDSCNGGGSPIIDKGTPGGVIKARQYDDYADPIWGAGTDTFLTKGETRLNGEKIDGLAQGFTGGPELFSFTTDNTKALNAGFFGFYNAGNGETAYEVLGEIMLFSSVLDAETRGNIEAYLMNKWLGTVPAAFEGWRKASVAGAGTVVIGQQDSLPKFDDDFAGTLNIESSALAFTLDGATQTATDALAIGGTLKLAEEGALSLSFGGNAPKAGTYVLATYGSLAAPGLEGWTLPETLGKYKCRFTVGATSLSVELIPPSLVLIVK